MIISHYPIDKRVHILGEIVDSLIAKNPRIDFTVEMIDLLAKAFNLTKEDVITIINLSKKN